MSESRINSEQSLLRKLVSDSEVLTLESCEISSQVTQGDGPHPPHTPPSFSQAITLH